jgi:predicted AlkP superfamily pyrophosphatase or phosphodiesterase
MLKKICLAIIALSFSLTGFTQAAKHVIFITIDGFRPNYYLDTPWHTPNLRALMKEGAYAEGVNSVFPSMTYPSHTTIVTGVQPEKHGVYYNAMFEPMGATGKIYWQDSAIHVPTIWEAARKKGMKVAALFWPVSADAPVDYNIPDVGSAGDVAREKFSKPAGFTAELRKELFGGVEKIDHGKDQNIAKIAAYIIKKDKPGLMTIHLFSVDHASHLEGRSGNMVKEAIADADEAIGIIIAALKEQGIWNSTVLMIGGDHGFKNVSRNVYPNVWLKNAGLMNDEKKDDWKAQFFTVGGSAWLYLKDKNDIATVNAVHKILDALPDTTKRFFRMVDRNKMNGVGANPEVVFALTAENEASFGNANTGDAIRMSKGGAHGHFPDTKEIRTGLIAHGPGIKRGAVIPVMDVRDMAPIISKLLGLSFPPAEGKIPAGLLNP